MEQITLSRLSPETFESFTPQPTQIKNNNLLLWTGGIILTGIGLYYLFRKPKKEKR
jgi:LPXTG-motif cell wall-anchored protein|tara:strand:- start:334 stop:501 length:168 start_codon:yes stop_codon:yes gene_type:complete